MKRKETVTNNSPRKMYINKTENKIGFSLKIKAEYFFQLLTPDIIKLFGIIDNNVTKSNNGENIPHLEITQIVLVYYNIVNNVYQQDSIVLLAFRVINHLVNS